MNEGHNICRYIGVYSRSGDEFLREMHLSNEQFSVVCQIMDLSETDDLYDCYPLTEDQGAAITAVIGVELDFSQFDFFLEAEVD